jgi:hypothetical protein
MASYFEGILTTVQKIFKKTIRIITGRRSSGEFCRNLFKEFKIFFT